MELNHLRHFYEVAKSGSFAKASQRLRISQSSLSKAVKLLEESGHVTLFERSKQGVALTAVGHDVFNRCEQMFEMFGEIESVCLQRAETCEGSLRLGASDHVSKYLLLEPLRRLKEKYPKLQPSLFSAGPNEIVSSLLDNEIEFGLFFTRVDHPQIRYEALESYPMAVVCHQQLSPPGKLVTPGELKRFVRQVGLITSIQNRYSYNPSESILDQLGHPPVNFEINSQEAQKAMCLSRGGVCVLARFMVEDEIKRGTLREIRVRNPIELTLHLAQRSSRSLSYNASVFLKEING